MGWTIRDRGRRLWRAGGHVLSGRRLGARSAQVRRARRARPGRRPSASLSMCRRRYARSGSRSGHRRIFVDVEPRAADHRALHTRVQLRSRRACVERAGVEPARDAGARRRAATSSRQRSRAASVCPGRTLLRRPRHPRIRARASEGRRRDSSLSIHCIPRNGAIRLRNSATCCAAASSCRRWVVCSPALGVVRVCLSLLSGGSPGIPRRFSRLFGRNATALLEKDGRRGAEAAA